MVINSVIISYSLFILGGDYQLLFAINHNLMVINSVIHLFFFRADVTTIYWDLIVDGIKKMIYW